jgi:hypothetical protein
MASLKINDKGELCPVATGRVVYKRGDSFVATMHVADVEGVFRSLIRKLDPFQQDYSWQSAPGRVSR